MNLSPTTLLPSSVLIYWLNVALASIVACGVGLVLAQLLRGMSLPTRHAVCVGALIVTLMGPFLAFVTDASGIALLRVTTEESRNLQVANAPQSRDEGASPHSLADARSVNVPSAPGSAPAIVEPPTPPLIPRSGGASTTIHQSPWTWSRVARLAGTVLVAIWAAGCVVGLAVMARGLLQLKRFLKHLAPVSKSCINEVSAQVAAVVGLSSAPPIYQSRLICAPLSVGLLRPRVVIPAEMLSSGDVPGWRALLLHEFAHVARGDHYVGLLQRIVVTLFWWNPLVRLATARISSFRERICDDVATSGDTSSAGYAAMLIELAGRLTSVRSLPATIGLFDGSSREFSDRVRRLFDDERSMITTLDPPMKVLSAGVFAALLLLTGATTVQVQTAVAAPETSATRDDDSKSDRALESQEQPQAASVAVPAIAWPTRLHGNVTDSDGKPIAGARVRLDLEKIHEYSSGRWDEQIHSQTLVTDETGKYEFGTAEFPKLTHRPFSLTVSATAPNFADAKRWTWYTREDVSVDEKFQNLKMLPGRLVAGRCVDPSGNPVVGAIVKVASDYDADNLTTSWAWDPRVTDERGEFQVSVPRKTERDIELWIIHKAWAPQRVEVLEHEDRQPDIVLSPGSVLSGVVRAEGGAPVVGAVVVARSIDDGDLDTVTFAAQVAVKTDAEGRYRLPPLLGDYKVFLAQAERTDERLEDNFVVADEPPPLVVPAKVTLVGEQPQTLDFRAGPTLTVRGHIRWPDGRPAVGAEVRASYLPQSFGTGIDLGDTETNKNGEYSLELPKPIDMISISAYGDHDENRKWHYAHADPDVEAESKGLQFIQLTNLETDRDGIDWVLQPTSDWPKTQ